MRGTEVLHLLREKPGSYIEDNLGVYSIKDAEGALILDRALEPIQFDDLVDHGRIKKVGNNKYGPVDPVG